MTIVLSWGQSQLPLICNVLKLAVFPESNAAWEIEGPGYLAPV